MINTENLIANVKISDKKLCPEDQRIYDLCKKYGQESLEARRKFAGLLPEVFKRKIYLKKGFNSIFEFAAKLAGMSQEQVRLVLNIEKRFESKPLLKNLLVSGEVSVNKLARVVAVASQENQEFLADQVKLLSQSAVETLVRDIKMENNKEEIGLDQGFLGGQSLRAQTLQSELVLDSDVMAELYELQEKGININELIKAVLKNRREDIAREKENLAVVSTKSSRYVPMKIKKIMLKEHGVKCSISGCKKNSETIHHTQRFAISQNHDPHYLQVLCSEHHEIAHSIDVKFHQVKARSFK